MAATVSGWVDARRRSLITVQCGDNNEAITAWVDTGFNGALLFEATRSNLEQLPVRLTRLYGMVEVVGGSTVSAFGRTTISWLGERVEVESVVALTDKHHGRGDPIAFVGTALLSGSTLAIDFLNGVVRIDHA